MWKSWHACVQVAPFDQFDQVDSEGEDVSFETMQQALFDSFVSTDPCALVDTEEAADVPEPHLDAGEFEADDEQGQSGPTMAPTMDIQELYALPVVRQFQVFGEGDSDPGEDKVDQETTAAPAPEPSAPSGIRRASPSRSRTHKQHPLEIQVPHSPPPAQVLGQGPE